MKNLIILTVCLTFAIGQRNQERQRFENWRRQQKQEVDDFVDVRACAEQDHDVRTSAQPDGWACLCETWKLRRQGCEQEVRNILQRKPDLKLCMDQPNYYVAQNRKCHYEAGWDASNDPAGKALQFALDLYRAANPMNPEENYIISPLSLQILLAQLTDGCSEPARIEMIRAVQLNGGEVASLSNALVTAAGRSSAANKLDIASVFFKSTNVNLTNQFNLARKENKIQMVDIDFTDTQRAVQQVNEWAYQKTRGNIPQVVTAPNLSPDMAMLLLNAIYFKGTWLYRFNETDTNKRGTFEVTRTHKMPVQMMTQTNRLRYGEIRFDEYYNYDWGLRWVELPYDGDELSMILMLPKERHQLEDSMKHFNSTHMFDIFRHIAQDYNPNKIIVKVPKFTIRNSLSLVQPLKTLGIKRIFDEDTSLSELSKTPTKVADVKQEAFLSVNEKGTTAAAVSKVTIIPLSLNSFNDIDFTCDQPFLAIIVDKVKQIPLFLAKINQPLKPRKEDTA